MAPAAAPHTASAVAEPSDALERLYNENPRIKAWGALDDATNAQKRLLPGPVQLEEGQFKGKSAVIIGAGVSGLTTAYELLANKTGMRVTVLEAANRTGGRCRTLRVGDTLTEDADSDLFGSEPGETQTVRFKQPIGDAEPYLNAGPGRIPSAHVRLLTYLQRFGVEVEVYVMNSMSNLVQKAGSFGGAPKVYRNLDHNTRGWLAQMVYEKADELLQLPSLGVPPGNVEERARQLRNLMVSFGQLIPSGKNRGKWEPDEGEPGLEEFRSRAGFVKLPGVDPGRTAEAIKLDALLESEYWKDTRFHQPADFLWQPTSFQPVGGMDMVERSFAKQVTQLGGDILLNHPVKRVDWDADAKQFVVHVQLMGSERLRTFRADYCFSNVAIPFLSRLLAPELQSPKAPGGFPAEFKAALGAVYEAQFGVPRGGDFEARFLAMTTKVGWQAQRSLWQTPELKPRLDKDKGCRYTRAADSEVGVVPIFGGISWTDHPIAQIWYPSHDYHSTLGVLTGQYNFAQAAFENGLKPVRERLRIAREGALALAGERFAAGLQDGVAVAWQNIPYIKGGWAQWHTVGESTEEAVRSFNTLTQGAAIDDGCGGSKGPVFFVIGDQVSSLPGWQEGAIAAALMALSRLARPDLEVPYLKALPDTRLMVEGV